VPDLRLSVLDQTPVSEGTSAAQALRNSIDLARLADGLGYHRYWVAEHHGGELVAGEPEAPEPWLLGSSEQSALWAGEMGLRYAFADFINPRGASIAETYRRGFVAGQRLGEPRLAIAVPPPEKAQRYLQLHDEEREGSAGERRRLVGTPAQVRADIEETVAAYGAEEAIVVTITHDHQARRLSYELLAEEFGQAPKGG
jgi:alkanesulfonate monooxygenase SsuD/methylene tetrahydromethanopterin reductase-like flavin-dependent oxidoreductase (luciferase family)